MTKSLHSQRYQPLTKFSVVMKKSIISYGFKLVRKMHIIKGKLYITTVAEIPKKQVTM